MSRRRWRSLPMALGVVALLARCSPTVPVYVPGDDGGTDVPNRGNVLTTVSLLGYGHGQVRSDQGPTLCDGSTCTFWVAFATNATLTAVPDEGSTFLGWSGGCEGTGACVIADGAQGVAARFGAPGYWSAALDGTPLGVAVTPEGDVVLLAFAERATELDGKAMGPGVILARLDGDGHVVWARTFHAAGAFTGRHALAIDGSGRIFAAYSFGGFVQLGIGDFLTGPSLDLLVAAYGPDGTPLWAKSFGASTTNEASVGLALDASGDLVVAGRMDQDFWMDGVQVHADALDPSPRSFVARLAPDGTVLSALAVPLNAVAVTTGPGGDAYVVGHSRPPDAGAFPSSPPAVRLARVRPDGTLGWRSDLPVEQLNGDDGPAGLVVSGFGETTVVGGFRGAVAGARATDFSGGITPFMIGFGGDGSEAWVRAWTVPGNASFNDVATDGAGNLYVAGGTTWGPVKLSETMTVADSLVDPRGFVARFSPSGDPRDVRSFKTAQRMTEMVQAITGEQVSVNAAGVAVVQGRFYVPIDFGDAARTPFRPGDLYLARVPAP